MLARIASFIAIAAILSACGDRQIAESPRPAVTNPPTPTMLSLADLVASGRLRVAFNKQNISCVSIANQAPPVTGPCVDIAEDLASQLRTRMEDLEYDTVDLVFEAGRRGDWDIAFTAIDPKQVGLTFTPAYLVIDETYLVPGDSPFKSTADVDRPGVRIAVFSPSAVERYLRTNLKAATLVLVPSLAHAAALIEAGQADVYAGSRAEVVNDGWRLADGRVLGDSIFQNPWGVAVASARTDLLAYVTRFLEDAKNAGVVQDAIDKYRLEGARISP